MLALPFNTRLGPYRHIATAVLGYIAFALVLVYIVAPLRAFTGHPALAEKLGYDAERWLATAIYDKGGNFVGTFDPRLDSLRDVNYSGLPVTIGDYVANPDHKSIPVRVVPDFYWQCLSYHEDRHLGGILNPFGIDLAGVLKIPLSTVSQSIAAGRPRLGVGGSTLPMQFARVIYKTPPSRDEGAIGKLKRKLGEWWIAPVIYRELTAGGDDTKLKQWAANHIWLAQRTGGQPLHGVEVTSQVVFGKQAADLSIAEQFVLASAVNKPIILLEGSDRLNEVRLDRWRYITEVRARTCAEQLITDEKSQRDVVFELMALAGGPPDPKVRPEVQEALKEFAPEALKRAEANPTIRANVLLPSARYAMREEMKQRYGFAWRDYVRGVTTTFDVGENLGFRRRVEAKLSELDVKWRDKIKPGFTLDPKRAGEDAGEESTVSSGRVMPHIVIAAADIQGNIVRYYESGHSAAYYGSWPARDSATGLYAPAREGRMIASTGKMLAAIALANQGRDSLDALYPDSATATAKTEACGGEPGTAVRRASVVFACSSNLALMRRTAAMGQTEMKRLVSGFGFAMPPASAEGPTPYTTAAVLGQLGGAPRRVHHMSSIILAALVGQRNAVIAAPSLIRAYDYTSKGEGGAGLLVDAIPGRKPADLISRSGHAYLRGALSAPLCHEAGGQPVGTLRTLYQWCAARHRDVRLHFAKTGTQSGTVASDTVDVWLSGGVQFRSGAAYSYIAVIGTGSATNPWADNLHSGQVAAPLFDALLKDLLDHSTKNPAPKLLPRVRPKPSPRVAVSSAPATTAPDVRSASSVTPQAPKRRALTPGEEQLRAFRPY